MLGLPPSEQCYKALLGAYSEPHRHYHTTEHIDAMLAHLDSVQGLAEHPAELELAIWFHDAIYNTYSTHNERDSADWAKRFLSKAGYSKAGIERVYKLIMATLHNVETTGPDESLIVDIDLTILGAPFKIYEQFENNIRKEYRLIPAIIYRRKRKEILKGFLNKKVIYNTDYFRAKYEQTARKNIEWAIKNL